MPDDTFDMPEELPTLDPAQQFHADISAAIRRNHHFLEAGIENVTEFALVVEGDGGAMVVTAPGQTPVFTIGLLEAGKHALIKRVGTQSV